MLRLLLFALPVIVAVAMYWASSRRTGAALMAQSTELTDPLLRTLVARMAGVLELPEIRVFVYEVPVVNGLAAPDGRIFLTRGFMHRYRAGAVSADEMASVVAHELGHVALGHARRRMLDFSAANAIRLVLIATVGRILPGLGIWIANGAAALLAARLSRQDEYEADAYAAALLVKAGIGTGPQKALLAKLGRIAGQSGPVPAWLMSHPATADRVAAIETMEARWRPALA